MNATALSENLARFGFSSYETKAYIALLHKNPVSGYELAKNSRIPPSKIYEVLNKLLNKSVVIPTGANPVKYVPQDVGVFLKNLKDETCRAIESLEQNLPKGRPDISHTIWQVPDRSQLLHKAKSLIDECIQEILISGWPNELEELIPVLEKKKGVKIAAVVYGELSLHVGTVYNHTIAEIKRTEKGGREFTLVTDNHNLLQAIIPGARSITGVWTTNETLVDVAKDFILHDIYCWKMIARCESHIKQAFGADFSRLRKIFTK
jgi:HTH-type transcriptional regulator, sugar sensing transcriptional regulator